MIDDVIRLREEVAMQIKALKGLKEMAQLYGYDISQPAKNAREAVQWLYFGYLGAVKTQNGDAKYRVGDALVAFNLNDALPDTNGKTVKLTIRWKSSNGDKKVDFNYCSRKAISNAKQLDGYGGSKLGQGADACKALLKDNPELLDELEAKVRDRALAEVFLNLRHGCLEGFQFSLVGGQFALFYLFCHILLMFKV